MQGGSCPEIERQQGGESGGTTHQRKEKGRKVRRKVENTSCDNKGRQRGAVGQKEDVSDRLRKPDSGGDWGVRQKRDVSGEMLRGKVKVMVCG